jgi:hypothetical protein
MRYDEQDVACVVVLRGDVCLDPMATPLILDDANGDELDVEVVAREGVLVLDVVDRTPGSHTLTVRAHDGSGRTFEDRLTVNFVQANRINVRFDASTSDSSVALPILAGSHLQWVMDIEHVDAEGQVTQLGHGALMPNLAITGPLSATITEPWIDPYRSPTNRTQLDIDALEPGAASITISAGGATRNLPIEVIGADEVVAAEVLPLAEPRDLFAVDVQEPFVLERPLTEPRIASDGFPSRFALGLRTASGRRALGGPRELRVMADEGMDILYSPHDVVFALEAWTPGRFALVGQIGSTPIELPFQAE